jgi:hypothetical protein
MGSCFVYGCHHQHRDDYEKRKENRKPRAKRYKTKPLSVRPMVYCKLYIIPTDAERRKRWLRFCRRADKEPNKVSAVCSCHFVNADRANDPTLNGPVSDKEFRFSDPEPMLWRKRKLPSPPPPVSPKKILVDSETNSCPPSSEDELVELRRKCESLEKMTCRLKRDNLKLLEDNRKLEKQAKVRSALTFDLVDEKSVQHYTGLSRTVALALIDALEERGSYYKSCKVSTH